MHKSLLSTILLASLAFAQEPASPSLNNEAMEVGGVVAVGYIQPDLKKTSSAYAELDRMELSAKVNLDKDFSGNIVLGYGNYFASPGQVIVDQAYGALTPEGKSWELYFGQQYYNYGLGNTRLITFPMAVDNATLLGPGLQANYKLSEALTLTGGSYYLNEVLNDLGEVEQKGSFGGLFTLGLTHESFSAKASGRISSERAQADLGAVFENDFFALEGEGFSSLGANKGEPGSLMGALASAEIKLGKLSLAGRWETQSGDEFDNADQSWAAGLVYHAPKEILLHLEYRQDQIAGQDDGTLRFQVSHNASLKLPGYQRTSQSE